MIQLQTNTPGARYLLMGASFVIVVAGLREGQAILLPFALALFLANLVIVPEPLSREETHRLQGLRDCATRGTRSLV